MQPLMIHAPRTNPRHSRQQAFTLYFNSLVEYATE